MTSRSWHRRAGLLVAAGLLVGGALGGCGKDYDDPGEAGGSMNGTTDELVCGLVDPALVRRVVGDAEIGTRGGGIRDRASRSLEPAHCTIQNADLTQTVLQVSIGEVEDPDHWREQLEFEASRHPGATTYTGDPGIGYGRTYDSGLFVAGASVYVLRGDRMIRATVHHWPGVTPEERLALVEEIVRDLDRNVSDYDQQRPE